MYLFLQCRLLKKAGHESSELTFIFLYWGVVANEYYSLEDSLTDISEELLPRVGGVYMCDFVYM